MFIYCNSNPVAYKDSEGKAAFHTTMYTYGGGSSSIIPPHAANTPENQTWGMVNGQATLPYAGTSIGLGSYERSGCAYIASYNAMQLLGQPQSLQAITDEFFWQHGMVAFGAGGAGPWSINNYFTYHNIEFTGSQSSSKLTNSITEGSILVFTIWNNKHNIFEGWHAMTALYTQGNYLVFNRYNDAKDYESYPSIDAAIAKGAWIYGICIDPAA